MDGGDEASNLVLLTPREHFIAHALLCRAVAEPDIRKRMNWALMLFGQRGAVRTSRMYDRERERVAREGKPAGHGAAISAALKGRPPAWRRDPVKSAAASAKQAAAVRGSKNPKSSAVRLGKKRPEHAAALRGRPRPAHVIEAVRQANLGKPKPRYTCQHCGAVVGGAANLARWHGDNCKHRRA